MSKLEQALKFLYSTRRQLSVGGMALLLLCTCALPAHAQVLYGSLTGNVADASGAVVSGAKVTALQASTGVTQAATTDSSGIYRFTTLPPGTYKVTISSSNFATQETSGVRISANEIARVNAALKVASTTQNVTVTTEARRRLLRSRPWHPEHLAGGEFEILIDSNSNVLRMN